MALLGYARVSTDGQTLDAQITELKVAGVSVIFQEKISGAAADRAQLKRAINALAPGDVLMVTRLDRLARSTRDLLNTLAAVSDAGAGFKSLRDTWADTTTAHGRLYAHHSRRVSRIRARTDPQPDKRRAGARKEARRSPWPKAEAHSSSTAGSTRAPGLRRHDRRNRKEL